MAWALGREDRPPPTDLCTLGLFVLKIRLPRLLRSALKAPRDRVHNGCVPLSLHSSALESVSPRRAHHLVANTFAATSVR